MHIQCPNAISLCDNFRHIYAHCTERGASLDAEISSIITRNTAAYYFFIIMCNKRFICPVARNGCSFYPASLLGAVTGFPFEHQHAVLYCNKHFLLLNRNATMCLPQWSIFCFISHCIKIQLRVFFCDAYCWKIDLKAAFKRMFLCAFGFIVG